MRTLNSIVSALVFSALLFFTAQKASAVLPEGDEKAASDSVVVISPNAEFIQIRNDDGSRTLQFSLTFVRNMEKNGVAGVNVEFLTGPDLSKRLSIVKTNFLGKASMRIAPGMAIPVDDDGMMTFGVRFPGNEKYEAAEEQIMVKDLRMKLDLDQEDSLRNLSVTAFGRDATGAELPVGGLDVVFYVTRMFAPLKVGEATLDSTGQASIEFPLDLPGDSAGFLNIFARLEEHDTYGTVEADTLIQWGIPTLHRVPGSFRALWTKIAPTWMVITLIILLAGVWGHYAYAVYKLSRIKKASVKDKSL